MTESSPDNTFRVTKETPSLRELTTRTLRNAILNMHFKPNERLVERRLCERMGVSRTCVREALQHLESEGLIERIPNRGLFIATVTPDEARQIYEVRAALESAAGRKFVEHAGEEDLEALETALSRIETSIDEKSVMAHVKALDEFYEVLLRGAGNEVARRVLRSLRARMNYLRALTTQASSEDYHAETLARMRHIVDAATSRDAEAAADRCRDFVERSAKLAAQVFSEREEKQDSQ